MGTRNPNALVGGLSGIAGGQVVVNLAHIFGWDLSAGWAMTVAGVASYVVLFIGREGFAGVWNLLKHGTGGRADGP